jgi:hypothetical protein
VILGDGKAFAEGVIQRWALLFKFGMWPFEVISGR